MNRLEKDLTLPEPSQTRYGVLTHSVPFGAHSFIENNAEGGIYTASNIHSDASFLPLLHRGSDGSAQTIKHLTWKQLIAEGSEETQAYASQVKQKKKQYKTLRDGNDTFNTTLRSFRNAVKGYYESSESLRSRRLVKAHAMSLGVASDLVQTTINGIDQDSTFLKKRGNQLHRVTEAVASHYEDTKHVIDDLHDYVREHAVSSNGVAADDPQNHIDPRDMESRLAVWSSYFRPTANQLVRSASKRSKVVDDQKDYAK